MVVAKVYSAWLLTYLITLVAVLGSGLVVLTGHEGISLVPAFVVACAAGALAYVALFIALSLRFSRALIIGLGYVFVWEAIISQFIAGVRFLSIRAYTVGIADALTDVDAEILTRSLDVTPAVVLLIFVVALGGSYATRAVTRFQISERV